MRLTKQQRSDPDLTAASKEIQAVYADLAELRIERNCELRAECCHFKLTGKTPMITKGEALVAAKALRHSGRKQLPERTDGACRLLHPRSSRCMIYEGRPFGCRTHFCEAAGGPYARKEVLHLIRRLEVVDETVNGEGPRDIHAAIEDVLQNRF